jgi:hypothetical protein
MMLHVFATRLALIAHYYHISYARQSVHNPLMSSLLEDLFRLQAEAEAACRDQQPAPTNPPEPTT